MTDTAVNAVNPEFKNLVSWIEAETGLCFPDVHQDTIQKVALQRCAELELSPPSFESLLILDQEERNRFFNRIMIGETYFFRDEKQFSILISHVLPELLRRAAFPRLWSATCATGEEAISLVATVQHVRSLLDLKSDFSVLASDINQEALARLETGDYPLSSFRTDGKQFHSLLDSCGTLGELGWKASTDCLARVEIRHLNIVSGELPPPDSIDVVFFRNTLVYMKAEQKERTIARIVKTLKSGGYLFLASPEIPTVRHPDIEIMERNGGFFFRKRDGRLANPIRAAVAPRPAMPPRHQSAPSSGETRTPGTKASQRSNRLIVNKIGRQLLQKGLTLASLWAKVSGARDAAAAEDAEPGTGECALMVSDIIEAIHANRFSRADELLERFSGLCGEEPVCLYLQGLSLRHQGKLDLATDLWERARLYDPLFWPGLFQAGMAYAQSNPERSATLLRECLIALEKRPEESAYSILLENFDISYYRLMAEKMLARVKKT
jgi:chemotaxis protein methyltransferase CheR